MSEIIVVTNRRLCKENLPDRIEKLCEASPKAIILREKDLTADEYKALAKEIMLICEQNGVKFIIHSFPDVAMELNCKAIHLPLSGLAALNEDKKSFFSVLGASCHSVEDAKKAESMGCTYIMAGHVFDTDCKKGLPGRGLDFLEKVCSSVQIPVYAIGGIERNKMQQILKCGAKGACIMSAAMIRDDVTEYLREFGVKNEIL